MTKVNDLYGRMIAAMGVEGLSIPTACVKIYKQGDPIPTGVVNCEPEGITLTSCQSARQAGFGDSVLLTTQTIGCVAAAISFGLVDKNQDKPIGDSTVYTDIMKQQAGDSDGFVPPSPKDFSEGTVYACTAAGRPEFALFGEGDTGRFNSTETARRAMDDMIAIQPADTQGVFLYALDFDEEDVQPDVVVMSVRSVELTRIIQAYQFHTGKRINASMGGLRVVNSDLIVRPYLTGELNVSTYCLGARLIAEFEGDRLGIGMPFSIFEEIVRGMEKSKGGFPFPLYPGAKPAAAA
ncbi:MAG: DUF169 domain-containing protein [Alphaproteobacteria bacterium]